MVLLLSATAMVVLPLSLASAMAPARRGRFAAGHEQVEQDRASPVLPYHEQLARQTAVDAPGGSEPHRQREYR